MERQHPHNRTLRGSLFVFIITIIVLAFPATRDLIQSPHSGIETQNLVVQNVRAGSPNEKVPIQVGDEIIAVDGQRVRNYNHLRYLIRQNAEFAPQTYTFLRDGQSLDQVVRYITIPSSIVYRRFANMLVGFTFLLMGLFVLSRRSDAVGILFSLNCTILFFLLGDRPIFGNTWLQLGAELFHDAVILIFPALFLHFFLLFPERQRDTDAWKPSRLALIYSLPILVYLGSLFFAIRKFFFVGTGQSVVQLILIISTLYMMVYMVASLVLFARNYRRSSNAGKQKVRIAIAGTIVGLTPFLFMIVWRMISPTPHSLLESLSVVSLSFISISFAYAILKHGAIELNIVVRKSLVYTLLTGVIIAAYYMLVNLIGDYLTTELHLRKAYFSTASVLVLAVIFAPARAMFQRLVDRLFFRGEYDYKHEVVEFDRQLSKKLKKEEVLEYFADRTQDLLKASFVAFYFTDTEDTWRLDKIVGTAPDLPTSLAKESPLGVRLGRSRKPLMVEFLDYEWKKRHLDEASERLLTDASAAVCLPVRSQESTSGVILLGPKLSGLLYSRTDSELLETFSEHLGLVLENTQLHAATFERERLKNEVMLAREIQLSLVPESPPNHPMVELLGEMVSSEEVGGDYFDYFSLDSDRIGMAIGDVSGKGVPAAMLMSSLQAVFKNLAVKDKMGPGELITELNRYLCGNSKTGQFATFFYGILDLENSTFIYSNAGHCPALLVKADYVDHLGEGGMLLGVEPERQYEEGFVRVDGGDIICMFTDGITEQQDSEGDMFGEEGLIDFLRSNKNLPITELQSALFARILEFGHGHQSDDITNIIALHKGA